MNYKPANKSIHQWSDEEFDVLLRTSAPKVDLSPGFEARFWGRVAERQSRPRLVRLFRGLESWLPTPNLSGALAVVVIAFLVGGAGGVYSVKNMPPSLEAQRSSVKYLSGFREFQGIPASSVAAVYLKSIEEGSSA